MRGSLCPWMAYRFWIPARGLATNALNYVDILQRRSKRGRLIERPLFVFRRDNKKRKGCRKEARMLDVILKRFEKADEIRTFEKGKFELVHMEKMTIGRATYEPGGKGSGHVVAARGAKPAQRGRAGV